MKLFASRRRKWPQKDKFFSAKSALFQAIVRQVRPFSQSKTLKSPASDLAGIACNLGHFSKKILLKPKPDVDRKARENIHMKVKY